MNCGVVPATTDTLLLLDAQVVLLIWTVIVAVNLLLLMRKLVHSCCCFWDCADVVALTSPGNLLVTNCGGRAAVWGFRVKV